MIPGSAHLQELTRLPMSARGMALTFFAALFVNLLPWGQVRDILQPDAVALALLYFAVYQPARLPLAAAFGLGLVMDVANGNLLGHHALGYVAAAGAAMLMSRRILQFGVFRQALHVGFLYAVLLGVELLPGRLANNAPFAPTWWLACPIAAVLWPLVLSLATRRLRRGGDF